MSDIPFIDLVPVHNCRDGIIMLGALGSSSVCGAIGGAWCTYRGVATSTGLRPAPVPCTCSAFFNFMSLSLTHVRFLHLCMLTYLTLALLLFFLSTLPLCLFFCRFSLGLLLRSYSLC